MGANEGLSIVFLLYDTQTPIIDRVGEEFGTLIRLLDVLRHASKIAEVFLLEEKKKKEKKRDVYDFLSGMQFQGSGSTLL